MCTKTPSFSPLQTPIVFCNFRSCNPPIFQWWDHSAMLSGTAMYTYVCAYICIYNHNQWAQICSNIYFYPRFHNMCVFFLFQCFVLFLVSAFSCLSVHLSLYLLTFWSLKVAHLMRLYAYTYIYMSCRVNWSKICFCCVKSWSKVCV